MAIDIVKNPNASAAQKAAAGGYFVAEAVAHTALAVGIAGLACSAVGPCAAAAEAALKIGEKASADGNPLNELEAAKTAFDAAQTGAQRVQSVVNSFGDQVIDTGVKIKVPGVGSTDIDVLLTDNRIIEVGGPSKGLSPSELSHFGSQLHVLTEYAKQTSGQVFFLYADGTPQVVIDLAIKWLGVENVLPIP